MPDELKMTGRWGRAILTAEEEALVEEAESAFWGAYDAAPNGEGVMGALYAAAAHDIHTCDPADISLDGHSILEWRKAYLEGCKDMAEGIVTRVPDAQREAINEVIRAAAFRERARLCGEASDVR